MQFSPVMIVHMGPQLCRKAHPSVQSTDHCKLPGSRRYHRAASVDQKEPPIRNDTADRGTLVCLLENKRRGRCKLPVILTEGVSGTLESV